MATSPEILPWVVCGDGDPDPGRRTLLGKPGERPDTCANCPLPIKALVLRPSSPGRDDPRAATVAAAAAVTPTLAPVGLSPDLPEPPLASNGELISPRRWSWRPKKLAGHAVPAPGVGLFLRGSLFAGPTGWLTAPPGTVEEPPPLAAATALAMNGTWPGGGEGVPGVPALSAAVCPTLGGGCAAPVLRSGVLRAPKPPPKAGPVWPTAPVTATRPTAAPAEDGVAALDAGPRRSFADREFCMCRECNASGGDGLVPPLQGGRKELREALGETAAR